MIELTLLAAYLLTNLLEYLVLSELSIELQYSMTNCLLFKNTRI